MIKVIIFDLDGTVADTIYAIREGVNLTMSALGYPEHTYEEVLGFVNFGARHLIEEALPASARGDQTVVDQTLALYDRMYAQTYLHTDRCYDGIPEALEILHRDFRLAMLSNKQDAMVQGLVRQLFRPGLFAIAHGVRDGLPTKPDKTVPLQYCEELGVTPVECAFVGDSDVDVATAKNAGMLAVDVTWGYRSEEVLRQKGADLLAHTPGELVEIFQKLKSQGGPA